MKILKFVTASALILAFAGAPLSVLGADKKADKAAAKAEKAKGKAYPLKTCIVSDEKLGGDMGEPYVFTHNGQEVKLCCKSCLKDFNKDTAKYLKKIEDAQKKKKS